ncbi:MAG: hypothetical protein IKV67_01800 [Paludibacteraceae bacterium]|jgi:hypothetical protein|nr:hypothetical protein [Paludibacteraceae bacterium]
MNKIKYALVIFAGLLMFSCSKNEEALIYDNYDFISIKGDSVISSDGLQMLASTVDIVSDSLGTYSTLKSEVTVGNNVFNLTLFMEGANAGLRKYKLEAGEPLTSIGYVKYRSMQADSSFVTDRYAITSSNIDWKDVDNKTILFEVVCKGKKMLNDSTLSIASLSMEGKIRAIKQ